ncbi:N-formylglutamate amidohydrolase [Rhizobium sp. Leaf384]|uniref:N-formylglutamate amidohydrolase n=1 Tax=unclassified Rhizobium TaxID=2613769 RepID=UPI0007156B3C|nr:MULTISPECIES: N-formylglutamate amidohydrolase [unclassified Rhizobium]KQS76504.1 N-formylglutamate amidohydrolase [Rhizobium sp. Leaf383]KQS77773.1 N-formylglutamate amidohydrolase [Rhizobium sp. Leaf384]
MADEAPFEIIRGDGRKGLVLLGDHATNRLPLRYGTLGLPESAFARHIAYDIGVEPLMRGLAARLDVPAVMSRFSRLLIDPNRGEDDPTLIMKISDGAIISGNHPMSPEEARARLEQFHRPYHQAVADTIAEVADAGGRTPLILSLHSFTPAWKGVPRPWHVTVLWDTDDRAVLPLLAALRDQGDVVVGDNEPYDGALRGDTLYRHCMETGMPHALIEVRQDQIGTPEGVAAWVDRLAPIFEQLNARDDLHRTKRYPSRTGPYAT